MVRKSEAHNQCHSDSDWVIAYALLQSLANDLGKLRKAGLWETSPDEMRSSPWFNLPCSFIIANGKPLPGESEWFDTPHFILKQFQGKLTAKLCNLVFASSNGAIKIGQSDIIRLAKNT